MPREIAPAIIATRAQLRTISYAYEPRGDPPVTTLVEIHHYDLLDANGKIVQTKRVGNPPPVLSRAAMATRFAEVQAAITATEAL